ncbi:MAG: hydroxymethylbilane synthase [Deltaproteobacteria bacterium]|nr:hydroxymethylbilane synthase [Deltaproteobacteria bacterium]MBW2069965.1 hydroxymethylbilane synthase [Deltaproteobacteria bacterium]
MSEYRRLRIGTRGSVLALWQANWVKAELLAAHDGLTVDLVAIKTKGDKIVDVPLARVGGKGLFVKEIEEALLDGRIDLAVHSVKDMPAELPPGLHLAATPTRDDCRDALLCKKGSCLADLPPGAVVGTSSLRRAAQLLHQRPDFHIQTLRGNVDTRLRKLETEGYDAIILAAAGLHRLGLQRVITEYLGPETMLPAVGQGALGIETRIDDAATNDMVQALVHQPTMAAVKAERSFLHRLQGGCQVPIGALALLENGRLALTGMVADLQGRRLIRRKLQGEVAEAELLGAQLATEILAGGGEEILKEIYGQEQNCSGAN